MRRLSALLLSGAMALSAAAQTAEPPSPATLSRLGLATEWVSAVPLAGQGDGIASVQVIDARQIFVQTRGGLLVAFDAATGERQWSFRYETSDPSNFQVAVNDRYVFAVHGIKLVGIQRVTGIVEFSQNLPLNPAAAPVADGTRVYVLMAGNRMAAYEMPAALQMPDAKTIKAAGARQETAGLGGKNPPLPNPADKVAGRYPATSRNLNLQNEEFEKRTINMTAEPAGGFGAISRTPSLTVSGSLVPPYKAFDADRRYINSTPSLSAVGSLRQPYHLNDPTSKSTQRTPSISAIPPTLASLYESTNLRPRGLSLRMDWIYGSSAPLAHKPLLTKTRIWAFSPSPHVVGLNIEDGRTDVDSALSAEPTAQPGQALDMGYVPTNDGYLTAVELNAGTPVTAKVLWKANVGGYMNQTPLMTRTAIYQGGAHTGIARVDVATGDVSWRTDNSADTLVAVNDEHVYARDRHGKLYVYDRNSPADPGTRQAYPLAAVDLPGFTVNVTNATTDRVFLASPGGLFICLRDAAPKYAAPQMIAPPLAMQIAPPKPAEAVKPVEATKPIEAAPMTPAATPMDKKN